MDQNNNPNKVIFDEEEFQRPTQSFHSQQSKLVSWVIKYSGGYVENEKQATYIIIIFVVIALLVSFFVGSSGSSKDVQDEVRNTVEKSIKASQIIQ
ncbi:MAG: hypothetical protein UT07_C0012G0017 [Parcubacteria group bacterium GW2011_GWB1_38_8]|uniref:Uncharacterized protein n=1 Tax=Candidatus Zambryskibacteria bacterium RIFCSPLOWO2_02_FULL_39_14 TaxID=1802769 RepID=A0A1G2UGA9_9BACT|nr:MAG: hypothetical protein UT07_C0012G0017 [Parcubacteria group bacterium GW2011_GWB1_38_8]KKR30918.1 MAG: hypothetical protein UT62_C0004G0002 [Parcubacteria group bacterium GW2011_GWC1_39_8]OHA94578.1 MAG: hypothetical protein A3C62_01425 [Candidatus Zambryskibacteria bacterium RIFCSPHIGHO2_02_FULL_39_16]OHB08474.1 MAG: hypothetical protein A3I86_00255 [Candidatus Zambryskibacteria bacterium RIFCSPLOWO2_02_FULL_39_14]